MAWTYSDWETQADDASRLTRLRSHLAEVSAKMSADMSSAPGSVSYGTLRQYLADLRAERDRLQRLVSAEGSPFTMMRPRG